MPACLATGTASAQVGLEDNQAAIVLEMQRLMQTDVTLDDPVARRDALVDNLRKIPPLLETMDRNFPQGKYRPLAHRLALEALLLRRSLGDPGVAPAHITAAADRLLALATDDESRAQATFAKLQVALLELPPTTAPAGATLPATTTRASPAALADLGGRLVKLAGDYPKTTYAAPALFLAAGAYLELGRDPQAVAALDRLTRDYPKDSYSLRGLLILVQLHTEAGRSPEALQAKRRCVEYFPDSAAALLFRADIAKAESVGRPFFLRFRSVQGQTVDVTDHRGKTVLVYFFLSLAGKDASGEVAKTLRGLDDLAAKRGCVLLAVGADETEQADGVAKALTEAKLATPVLLDAEGKVAQQYGVLMVPSVAVIGPDGTMKEVVCAAEIVQEVERYLKSAATAPAASRPASAPAGR